MSAPWSNRLVADPDSVIRSGERMLGGMESHEVAMALVHRANAYPKLVEALRTIERGSSMNHQCTWCRRDRNGHSRMCPVTRAREALAAIQEEDDE